VQLAACRGGDALALGDRNTGDPDDFSAVGNHREGVTEMSRNVGVDEDVLEPFGLLEPQRPHAVARPAGGDDQRQLDEVGIEVTDLVTGPEGGRITGAGRDEKTRGR
jgi:hypothetical protein